MMFNLVGKKYPCLLVSIFGNSLGDQLGKNIKKSAPFSIQLFQYIDQDLFLNLNIEEFDSAYKTPLLTYFLYQFDN